MILPPAELLRQALKANPRLRDPVLLAPAMALDLRGGSVRSCWFFDKAGMTAMEGERFPELAPWREAFIGLFADCRVTDFTFTFTRAAAKAVRSLQDPGEAKLAAAAERLIDGLYGHLATIFQGPGRRSVTVEILSGPQEPSPAAPLCRVFDAGRLTVERDSPPAAAFLAAARTWLQGVQTVGFKIDLPAPSGHRLARLARAVGP